MHPPEMLEVLGRLREALAEAGVSHVFIGALPVLAWGRPRATTDFDFVVYCEAEGLERLSRALERRDIKRFKDVPSSEPGDPLPDMAIFWTKETPAIRVDVFVAKLDFEQAVLQTSKQAVVMGHKLPLASCEASIIYKLVAGRTKDIADVESMFEARAAANETLDWHFLDRWATEWEIAPRLSPWRAKHGPGTG